MKVCYTFVDFGHEETRLQRPLAAKSIASVRRHMPNAEIVHLTDLKTKTLDGVNSVLAMDWTGHNRGDFQAQIHGDAIFLDTDTIVTRDLTDVFAQDFDVAVTERHDSEEYNQGVVFSRNEKFWKAVANLARSRGVYDEAVFTEVVNKGGFKVLELPIAYNFAVPPGLAVLHFKGPRKKFMLAL